MLMETNMQTPFKTVDAALAKAGIIPDQISDERNSGNPIFVYLGYNGICRDDGAHSFSGFTANELIQDIKSAMPCDCDCCKADKG